jgi:coniferyl-aldehyde dehydrogenase
MNANVRSIDEARLTSLLAKQRAAFLREGAPSLARRRADLLRLKNALLARRKDYEAAINADFTRRPAYETAIMEIMPTAAGIDYLRANLRRWMRPRRRHVALHFLPASAVLVRQPLGVVGILAPWNYPAGLALMPLATAIAAGNRAMLKPSELTPRTSDLMAKMLGELFPEEQVAVVTGAADVGALFSALPFDHLVFTGSTSVGRAVMRAASENLVPVTLELGGKSPTIIDQSFSLARAAKSIAYGKLANAGQTCVAPDYALVPTTQMEAFIAAYTAAVHESYPAGAVDEQYAAIISDRHLLRLKDLIEDARNKGAKVVEIGARSTVARANTLAPTVIVGATPDMKVMQQEIFGPILPVIPYQTLEEAIEYVNARPRPLALYIFSDHRRVIKAVMARTTSGNVTVNDTLLHYVQDDLPFGGVGPSGMGAYHGEEGFRALSHEKGVFRQSRLNFAGLTRAPFGRMTDLVLAYLMR